MEKRIYIVAPSKSTTGGPETLHQMCSIINSNYPNTAYMVYVNAYNKEVVSDVPEKYQKYNVFVAKEVEDSEENLLIVTEYNSYFCKQFKRIKKIIVWLSLPFYYIYKSRLQDTITYSKMAKIFSPFLYGLVFLHHPLLLLKKRKLGLRYMKNNCICSYNTIEEKKFLLSHNIEAKNYVCGPISDEYFDNGDYCACIARKQKIISFNPKKGMTFTRKVIKRFISKYGNVCRFVPIENMTTDEVISTLKESSLYIDFGYFPGHERIPRQACLLFANLIVSRNGSAAYPDIAIPDNYKFATKDNSIDSIVELMYKMVFDYKNYVKDFDFYRYLTRWQRESFNEEVLSLCREIQFDINIETIHYDFVTRENDGKNSFIHNGRNS